MKIQIKSSERKPLREKVSLRPGGARNKEEKSDQFLIAPLRPGEVVEVPDGYLGIDEDHPFLQVVVSKKPNRPFKYDTPKQVRDTDPRHFNKEWGLKDANKLKLDVLKAQAAKAKPATTAPKAVSKASDGKTFKVG